MGSYVTNTTILDLFPGLPQTTTISNYTETVALIDKHITRAEALVNGYCSRRYSMPFDPAPPLIKTLTEDLSGYYVYRSKFTRDSHNTSEWTDELFKTAMDTLQEIKDEKIDLINTIGAIIEEKTAEDKINSDTYDYQPFFDVDSVTSWKVDNNRLSDINR